MLELLRDPLRAARLGEAAGRDAERFHPRAIVPRILAYYGGLLAAEGSDPTRDPVQVDLHA
jgi:hypothetical protein